VVGKLGVPPNLRFRCGATGLKELVAVATKSLSQPVYGVIRAEGLVSGFSGYKHANLTRSRLKIVYPNQTHPDPPARQNVVPISVHCKDPTIQFVLVLTSDASTL
jgi:hypothetical protein